MWLTTGAGPVTLGAVLGQPASTVGKVLLRLGLSRLEHPPPGQALRYGREQADKLLHIEIKKPSCCYQPGKPMLAEERRTLNRRTGWQYLTSPWSHSR